MQYSVFSIQYKKRNKTNDPLAFHTEYEIRHTAYDSHTEYGIQNTKYFHSHARGVTVVLVLAFMGIFAMLTASIAGYVFQQGKYGRAISAREQALHIAEAGLEYYKWWLGRQASSVLTTGVGLVSPYTYAVNDPEGGTLGSAVITATPALQCGTVQWIDLESRGTSNASAAFPRTLLARYMKPSVAEYANLYNSTVWIGSTNSAIGPQHANNGFRMDGWSNSTISSSIPQVYCDGSSGSLGCDGVSPNPSPGWKNGVFGLSSTTALWQYPIPAVDFPGMALNLPTLKGYAAISGIMLNPTSVTRIGIQQGSAFPTVGGVETSGFHLVFKSDGTADIYRVTATNSESASPATPVRSYNLMYPQAFPANGWKYTYPVIATEVFVANVSIPSSCALIYSEAKTWIDGTVSGKVALIAADTGSFVPDIILNNNISYTTNDGSSGLTAVAEGSIKLGLVVPDTLSVRGIFVAQTGSYSRDHYISYPRSYLPASYDQYIVRTLLNVTGTVVSNLRVAVCYGSGGPCASGFNNRNNAYDRILAFSPPPFTPAISPDYKLMLWREQ